jgi:hypothetical protein
MDGGVTVAPKQMRNSLARRGSQAEGSGAQAQARGASRGATPMEAGGNHGQFHLPPFHKRLIIDASGNSERRTLQLRTRRSHVRVVPGAPSPIRRLMKWPACILHAGVWFMLGRNFGDSSAKSAKIAPIGRC